ncbi:unnamed protein product [Trichobilharzia regenti]|nr:unnamed protein product [Trichobilharzia regenti]
MEQVQLIFSQCVQVVVRQVQVRVVKCSSFGLIRKLMLKH